MRFVDEHTPFLKNKESIHSINFVIRLAILQDSVETLTKILSELEDIVARGKL